VLLVLSPECEYNSTTIFNAFFDGKVSDTIRPAISRRMEAMSAPGSLGNVIIYGVVCAVALAGGGAVASQWPPSRRIRSYLQHIAAGFVFAAAGVEVLPDVIHRDRPLAAALGFSAGVALMLAIRTVSEKSEKADNGRGAWTFIGAVVADIFVDGLLIGVSSSTAQSRGKQALLVTIAVSAELLSLGLSMAAMLGQRGSLQSRTILTTSSVALSPLIGAVAGYFLGDVLVAGWIEGVLAFAAAVLLYLAAEELLKEAHEVPETAVSTAMFFAAFLALLVIGMLSRRT
jgi:ZIP family zinc transporter